MEKRGSSSIREGAVELKKNARRLEGKIVWRTKDWEYSCQLPRDPEIGELKVVSSITNSKNQGKRLASIRVVSMGQGQGITILMLSTISGRMGRTNRKEKKTWEWEGRREISRAWRRY